MWHICHLTPDHFKQTKKVSNKDKQSFCSILPSKNSARASTADFQLRCKDDSDITKLQPCALDTTACKMKFENGSWQSSKPHCRTCSQDAKVPTESHKSQDIWKEFGGFEQNRLSSENSNITNLTNPCNLKFSWVNMHTWGSQCKKESWQLSLEKRVSPQPCSRSHHGQTRSASCLEPGHMHEMLASESASQIYQIPIIRHVYVNKDNQKLTPWHNPGLNGSNCIKQYSHRSLFGMPSAKSKSPKPVRVAPFTSTWQSSDINLIRNST